MASAVRGPVLHVAFDAQCELTTGSGVRGQAYKQVGLVLDAATGLCVAAGPVEGRIVSFPASAVLKVHTKFVGSGKLTFEVATGGKQVTKQLLVSRATPEALKGILSTLDEAVKRARARNQKQLSQDECVALLRTRYPDQIKKQLAALQAAAGNDMPQPLKGHTRLMLVVDGAGASVAQAGKALLKAFESELQLTSHMRPGESNAQSFKAVCKDRADKSTQIEMRVRTCIHHRWANPLWIDLDLGEKPSVPRVRELVVGQMAGGDEANALVTQLAHGAIKERLAAGLVLHLRSGTLEHGTEFGTRAELRWNEHDPSTAPLGKAELRFWEDGGRFAAPVVSLFEMHSESGKAWSLANGGKPVGVLATSMVARLEIFCLRLAASASGAGTRTRLLVAGWKASVKTDCFVKRGFTFQDAPDHSLGYKMLKADAPARPAAQPAAAGKRALPAADASEAAPAASAEGVASSAVEVEAATSGADAELDSAVAEAVAAAGLAAHGKDGPADGGTPGMATGVGAAGKRRRVEEGGEYTPMAPPSSSVAGSSAEHSREGARSATRPPASQMEATQMEATQMEATQMEATQMEAGGVGAGVPAEQSDAMWEADDLGEISQLGRQSGGGTRDGARASVDPEAYVPVVTPAAYAGEEPIDVGAGGDDEEDELDATMAELLG